MRAAVCQLKPVPGDVRANMRMVIDTMESIDADLFVFPEMFLTGYHHHDADPGEVIDALGYIADRAADGSRCSVVGAPVTLDGRLYNTAAVCDGDVTFYRKVHLPGFGPFSEDGIFIPGDSPFTFTFKGFTFGLSICYDIFFPEMTKSCSMAGADANICISASPITSRTAFEKVLPARAIECTSYLLFANNVGLQDGTEFFGGSRALTPLGDVMSIVEGEGVMTVELDRGELEKARLGRPVLKDTVALTSTIVF